MLKILKQRVVDQNSNQILKKRKKFEIIILYYLELRNGAVIKTIKISILFKTAWKAK